MNAQTTGCLPFKPSFPNILSVVQKEYKRLETLRQIEEADRRTEEMTAKKEEMINQRRKAALEVRCGAVRCGTVLTSSPRVPQSALP